MTQVKVIITRKQRTELLQSDAVSRDVQRRTLAVHAAVGGDAAGYRAALDTTTRRVRGSVYTYDAKAIRDNAKNNTLVRNMDAGRG